MERRVGGAEVSREGAQAGVQAELRSRAEPSPVTRPTGEAAGYDLPDTGEGVAVRTARYELYRLRERHYDRIYISPHLDDAVYSCGGQIAQHREAGRRVLVITVFGSGQVGDQQHRGDVFRDAEQRKREELAAMELLDCDFVFLDQPDALHRKHSFDQVVRFCLPFLRLLPGEIHERMRAALEPLLASLLAPFGTVYFPLGVGCHPDHRLVFDVGRELHLSGSTAVEFYEDVAYVHVDGMLEDRLRSIGVPARLPFLRFFRGVHRLTFKRSPRWHSVVGWPYLFAFLLMRYGLSRVSGRSDRRPEQRAPTVSERDISQVLTTKVAAMRAYSSQTEFFFPDVNALPAELARFGGRYVERSWVFPPPIQRTARSATCAAQSLETRKVEALLRELELGPTFALPAGTPLQSRAASGPKQKVEA